MDTDGDIHDKSSDKIAEEKLVEVDDFVLI